MVTCFLLWITPSTCTDMQLQYGRRSLSQLAWGKLEAIIFKSNKHCTKPPTVALRDSYQESTQIRRRRIQLELDFTVQTGNPTFVPAKIPTLSPSPSPRPTAKATSPGIGPTDLNRQIQPTEYVDIEWPLVPVISKDTSAPFQPLKFAAVPVGFDVLLETDSQQDLAEMAQQAKIILEEYLAARFRGGFDEEDGVTVSSVDLNVKSFLTFRQHERLLYPMRRFLQLNRAITLEARGAAGFQVSSNINTEEFLSQVNSILDESVKPESLTSVFQNKTSGLTDYRVSMVTNTETALEEPQDKPTLVEVIIAIILLVLAAAGLVAYACIFWKKRQKRIRRRKQFGVGHKPPSPNPRPRPRGTSVTPSVTPGTVNGMPASVSRPNFSAGGINHSNSSESSYKGLGSDSDEEDADVFAKELRLAASLDRRAWGDFQKHTQTPVSQDSSTSRSRVRAEPSSSSIYNAETDVYRDLAAMNDAEIERDARDGGYGLREELPLGQGIIGLMVTGDTVSIQSNSSFPYGDEHDNGEYPASGQMPYVGTPQVSPLPGSKTMPTEAFEDEHLERDDTSGGWRMTKSASSRLTNNPASHTKPSRYSFLFPGHQSKLEPETISSESPSELEEGKGSISDRTSGALRGSPMSHSWSTNPPRGVGSAENATTAAIRGSPQSSSWNTGNSSRGISLLSQAGSFSASPAIESTAAVHEESSSAAVSEEASMMTADIVKEVQRLTQFVKTYERKKEMRMKRGEFEEGVYDATLSNSTTSGMEFDSLMETVNSLQNVVGHDPTNKATKNRSPTDLTTSPDTFSKPSVTPSKQTSSNSPEQPVSRSTGKDDDMSGIRSIHSDSSSDVETMESDDLSRRLGITPFKVQNPNTLQRSPVSSAPYHPGHVYQRTTSPEDVSISGNSQQRKGTASTTQYGKRQSSALSNLRQNDAILDHGSDGFAAPSDETRVLSGDPDPPNPFPLRHPQSIMPRQRSRNQDFNSIVSKFESKSQDPIYPPNESWQYNY
jgi:hypothetical protein